MKKLLIILTILLLAKPAFCEVVKGEVSFDWITKTQIQRDANINEVHNILFEENEVKNFPKGELKKEFSDYLKDKNHVNNYFDIANGKNEDETKKYSGFFLKNGLLVAYGIQYKNNMKNIFYYDAMGNLRFIDVFSEDYPEFPYYSSQYKTNGELVGKFYFVTDYDQYIFNADGKFKGRWFKENMYNRNAKIIMTRSNW